MITRELRGYCEQMNIPLFVVPDTYSRYNHQMLFERLSNMKDQGKRVDPHMDSLIIMGYLKRGSNNLKNKKMSRRVRYKESYGIYKGSKGKVNRKRLYKASAKSKGWANVASKGWKHLYGGDKKLGAGLLFLAGKKAGYIAAKKGR